RSRFGRPYVRAVPSSRDTRKRSTPRPNPGLQRGLPLPRRPMLGPGWMRTRQGWEQAQRGGAVALAQAGARVVASRPGDVDRETQQRFAVGAKSREENVDQLAGRS